MSTPAPFKIDHSVRFEHLQMAPIVEAVIDFRTRAEASWIESDIGSRLKSEVPDYPQVQRLESMSFTAQLDASGSSNTGPALSTTHEDHGWLGFRMNSQVGKRIAQFTRNGFSFSQLAPYTDWQRFKSEAIRLWGIHQTLSGCTEVQRIGVRFINRLEVPQDGLDFGNYFLDFAGVPQGMDVASFLHTHTMGVPGKAYWVKRIQTFQPPQPQSADKLPLLLDIDAFCPEPCATNSDTIDERLSDLQWLKNYVFFNTFSKQALDLCR